MKREQIGEYVMPCVGVVMGIIFMVGMVFIAIRTGVEYFLGDE